MINATKMKVMTDIEETFTTKVDSRGLEQVKKSFVYLASRVTEEAD